MFTVSIMLDGSQMKGNTPMRNILLVRRTRKDRAADLAYLVSAVKVLGWCAYDEHGMQEDSHNGGMCLNHTSAEFDDIDVCYRTRY